MVIRLPLLNAECRYLPGAGLDGMIVSGPGKDTRRLAVAAVLLFQQAHGKGASTPTGVLDRPGRSPQAPPRSRQEILRGRPARLLCDGRRRGASRTSPPQSISGLPLSPSPLWA